MRVPVPVGSHGTFLIQMNVRLFFLATELQPESCSQDLSPLLLALTSEQ